MKNKKFWSWTIGLSLVALLTCGGFIALGLWAADRFGGGSNLNLAFGEGIAIIHVEGVIVPGEAPPPNPFISGSSGGAYSQTIIKQLEQANKNDDVKAIILAVDSPGGSAYASDEIALKIKELDKPIITSMGSMAASGGYYVSAPTDEIWASPSTLTCSIGVILQFLNLEGFSEEYGITAVTVKSGKFKDAGNPFREFTTDERALFQTISDQIHDTFINVVVDGRSMSEEQVREIADGRICTGQQAVEFGLVDNLGYLPDVIERAAELGGIKLEENEKPRIIEYTQKASFTDLIAASLYRPGPIEELKQILHFDTGSPLMYMYVGP